MKRILMIAFYFPYMSYPESIQSGRLAKQLEANYQLDIVTNSANLDSSNMEEEWIRLFSRSKNINWISVNVRPPRIVSNRYFTKALSMPPLNHFISDSNFWWVSHAEKLCQTLIQNNHYDCIITRSQPFSSGVLGLKLKKQFQIPWVHHFSDPWLDSPFKTYLGILPNPQAKNEAQIFSMANYITVPSSRMVTHYQRKYNQHQHKIAQVGHLFDEDIRIDDHSTDSVNVSKINIVHAGSFYKKYRTPSKFIDCIALLHLDYPEWGKRLQVHFLGDNRREFVRQIEENGMSSNFKLTARVDYVESLKQMSQADILLLIDTHLANHEQNMFYPSKLADYLGLGKPILAIGDPSSEAAYILQRSEGLHCFVDTHMETRAMSMKVKAFIERVGQQKGKPANELNQSATRKIILEEPQANMRKILDQILGVDYA